MARGVNKCIIVGTLGQDPEIRYTTDEKAIANLSVATNEQWTDKQSGQKHEKTEWHRICAFGRLAEVIGEYLTKGSQVYIEGKLQTRKWQDQNGQDRYTTEIVANELQMLGGGQSKKAEGQHPQQHNQQSQGGFDAGFDDSDIPFNKKHSMEGW